MLDVMPAILRPLTNQSRCGRRSTFHLFSNVKVIYMSSAKDCSGFLSNGTLLSAGRESTALCIGHRVWIGLCAHAGALLRYACGCLHCKVHAFGRAKKLTNSGNALS